MQLLYTPGTVATRLSFPYLRTSQCSMFNPVPMNARHPRTVALAKATFAVLVWGASFIATKLVLREAPPVIVIWLRFGIGVIILGAFVLARKELAFPAPRELGYFSLLGFVGITFHQWLQVT